MKSPPNKVQLVAEEPTAVISVSFGEHKLNYPGIVVPAALANAVLQSILMYVAPPLRFLSVIEAD